MIINYNKGEAYRFWSEMEMRKSIQLQAQFLEQHACLAKMTTKRLDQSKMSIID